MVSRAEISSLVAAMEHAMDRRTTLKNCVPFFLSHRDGVYSVDLFLVHHRQVKANDHHKVICSFC